MLTCNKIFLTPSYDNDEIDDSAPPPYYAHSFIAKDSSLPPLSISHSHSHSLLLSKSKSKPDYRHSFVSPEYAHTINGLCQKLRGMKAKYKDNRETRKATRREKRPQDGKTNPFE
ncbi:hypothetical protein PHYBLDRAFT_161968 [Phycomyces blakesleeanus NRRL 1555(-)]|uniref:Uncharacterized protein n=1 Tax=Phycomyces blakesleeanus (strain ATCC 8743b / DSM 1359 / FGSC 10004 / NBRC 33097 / NRRL 1555) TaxID=763407 RepID=A0A167RCR9_PHYB8|nr:hypothetical protein PHYBLDRAFT_161968 [Phycomyces blakesleeanus NRRL 1555(-)]OAD81357.1 hypothetical protein PHYBLDRAFT_161968 [Phycomyces blakesleeanus NRRL 1555(-)]|eukprot:XP_018299397.1 hypothetical protein PHYBLDRAFT_161968 [Phycomyces blakesleeanus NRRL 1555(-)]